MRQGLTFRLADAVPAFLITKWKKELDLLEPHCGTTCWTEEDDAKWEVFNRRIAKYEDAGRGECLLRQPAVAAVVSDCLLHFSGERYDLLAWCVMPNHVHAVVAMKEGHAIGSSVKSWKGFSARKINQMLGREGRPLWFPDYHDRFMRNADHTHRAIAYVENNPVAAGLVASAQEWRWSSAGQPLAGRTASIPARKAVDGM